MRPARLAVAAALTAVLAGASAGGASASVPVLGGDAGFDTKGFDAGFDTKGFGRPHPSQIIYGGGAQTFNLFHVRWKHWGATQAYGTAKGWYVPTGKAISEGHTVTERLVAYSLGTCNGKRAYTRMARYVPSLGQHFRRNAKNDNSIFCDTP
jgi:hypothetical protein